MRNRRALVGATMIASVVSIIGSMPVKAADLGTVSWNGTTFAGVTLSGQVNDTFTLENTSVSSPGSLRNDTGTARQGVTNCTVSAGVPNCPSNAGSSNVYTVTQVGRLALWGSGLTGFVGYITISSGSGSSSSPSSTSTSNPTPIPVIQQFSRPTQGECNAAQPAGLKWAGVPSGGWAESWAQWANARTGGPVCTRTLAYSTSSHAWVLQ